MLAVSDAAAALIESARAGEGPGLLEAVTFRLRGHVGPNEDIDVGVHRKMEDVRAWRARCPILRLEAALAAADMLPVAAQAALHAEVARAIDEHTERARRAPYPEPAALLNLVYSERGP